jgi:transcriptional regulator with XRE-family HTH domain
MGINLLKQLGYDVDSAAVKNAREAARVYANVIDSLAECRKESGLKQSDVAERMGTGQSAVSELENVGADARFSTVIRYAQAIGCQLNIEIVTPGDETQWSAKTDWVRVDVREQVESTVAHNWQRSAWKVPNTVAGLHAELPQREDQSIRSFHMNTTAVA